MSAELTGPGGTAGAATLPKSLLANPHLDSWFRINSDGTVTVLTGKVEIGQGIKTALAQIAAEELDVSLDRIVMVTADTEQTPNEGYTGASASLEIGGNSIRHAAAEVRHILIGMAADQLEVPAERLEVDDGTITDREGNANTTYWELMAVRKFGRRVSEVDHTKSAGAYRVVGKAIPRLDIPAKVKGEPTFVQDLRLPGMVFGRVVRPPSYAAELVSVDLEAVSAMPGVIEVVCDGNFLAVVAEREEQAAKARDKLREQTSWREHAGLPPQEFLFYDIAV